MAVAGKTAPFKDADGAVLAGSIAQTAFVTLGGLPQWIMIRGVSAANPALIILHAGPGMPETPLLRHFNAPLERGAGEVQRGDGRGRGGGALAAPIAPGR